MQNLLFSSTTLHVLLEGLSLRDDLSWIIVFLWGWVTGVGLSSHGPSHLLGLGTIVWGWVRVDTSHDGSAEGSLGGRGKGVGRSNEGKEGNGLGLYMYDTQERKRVLDDVS